MCIAMIDGATATSCTPTVATKLTPSSCASSPCGIHCHGCYSGTQWSHSHRHLVGTLGDSRNDADHSNCILLRVEHPCSGHMVRHAWGAASLKLLLADNFQNSGACPSRSRHIRNDSIHQIQPFLSPRSPSKNRTPVSTLQECRSTTELTGRRCGRT